MYIIHPTTGSHLPYSSLTLGIKSCVALGPAVACTAVVEQMKENFSSALCKKRCSMAESVRWEKKVGNLQETHRNL